MHPDSYRDRGHFLFIEDYYEDPEGIESITIFLKKWNTNDNERAPHLFNECEPGLNWEKSYCHNTIYTFLYK